jgi:hypothetical protein
MHLSHAQTLQTHRNWDNALLNLWYFVTQQKILMQNLASSRPRHTYHWPSPGHAGIAGRLSALRLALNLSVRSQRMNSLACSHLSIGKASLRHVLSTLSPRVPQQDWGHLPIAINCPDMHPLSFIVLLFPPPISLSYSAAGTFWACLPTYTQITVYF